MARLGLALAVLAWAATTAAGDPRCTSDGACQVEEEELAALQVAKRPGSAPSGGLAGQQRANHSGNGSHRGRASAVQQRSGRAQVGEAPFCDEGVDICPEIVKTLNGLMMNQGVFVRQPEDNNVDSDCTVGSFWHASVAPPNVMYVWHEDEKLLYWEWPAVGYVIGTKLDAFYPGGLDSGNYAVYAHDSNACDAPSGGGAGRCWYDTSKRLWMCPGHVQDDSGNHWDDASSLGAGQKGGRGCHTNGMVVDGQWLNQGQATLPGGSSTLVDFADSWCECSASSYDNPPQEWVAAVKDTRGNLDGFIDPWMCHQNNNFAAVNLQNELWWQSGSDFKSWWGWNEFPIGNPNGPTGGWGPGKPDPDDPDNWDAVLIYLPIGSWDGTKYTAWDQGTGTSKMEQQLSTLKSIGRLEMGVTAVVFAKEYEDPDRASSYQRSFFCSPWSGNTYEICPPDFKDGWRDYCYIQTKGSCGA